MIVNYNINRNVGVKANGIATRVLGKKLFIEFEQGAIILKAGDERILFEGPLYYYFDQKETEYLLNKSEKYISEFLTKVIKRKGLDYCIRHLEGEYNTVIFNNTSIKIIGDRLKRREIFYSYNSTSLCVASDLEYLAKRKSKLDYDQNILALMLSSKYHYIPAGHTIYKDIYALAPDESIKYSKNGFEKNRILALKNIEEYDESKLLEYSGIFNRAVLGRVGRGLNIANSTGGWDTTYIITILVELLGKDKVVSSIYNCKFKDGKDWNIYEKIRAKKIAKHFNIRHMEVPLDFTSDVLTDNLRELLPCLRSKNIYIAPLPHFILYKGTRKWLGVKQKGTIFSGEAADSLHNFGFSQYLSFFHKSYAFKEYGDKTKNYLYGPDFFKETLDGKFQNDAVFKIWQSISGDVCEMPGKRDARNEIIFKYLLPVLLGKHRIPFEKVLTSNILTVRHRERLLKFLSTGIFSDIANKINEKNIYSAIINLYKEFHLQGPTLKMIPITAGLNGFDCRLPFLDVNMVEFLEKMPTTWGRGLEFNNTKYPLKAAARANKNFPIDIVEAGIHSYPTEADSTLKDVSYHFYFNSTAAEYFKQILSTHTYRQILDDKNFNIKSIDKNVNYFLNGRINKVEDYQSLIRIINLVAIGWY